MTLLQPPVLPPWLAWGILGLAGALLVFLLPLAAQRLVLLVRARRFPPVAPARGWSGPLPRVTVQLPVYNEAEVVERLLLAVAALDYPKDRLDVQVLDDSTDETRLRVERLLPRLRQGGLTVHHLRRTHRGGFKAGALACGLASARGRYLLLLDADFVPPPGLIRALLPSFQDQAGRSPPVGMVQARWDHLNEEASPLTRAQAVLLDAHFRHEQGGRHAVGHFINFNGTAGMWDREAIAAAGGWSADTLTEDLDLSYRAQMAGWRFVYRGDVGVPAELPEAARALEVQQARWARGGIQTARKLLARLWAGPWSRGVKLDGTFHLVGHLAHPATLALGVLLLPSAVARTSLGLERWLVLDAAVFLLATGAFLLFYLSAARARGRSWVAGATRALHALTLGVGLSAPLSVAVMRELFPRGRTPEPFHRTPKGGAAGMNRYPVRRGALGLALKGALALWSVGGALLALLWGFLGTLPFLFLFGAGWGWLAWADRPRRSRGRNSDPGGILPAVDKNRTRIMVQS